MILISLLYSVWQQIHCQKRSCAENIFRQKLLQTTEIWKYDAHQPAGMLFVMWVSFFLMDGRTNSRSTSNISGVIRICFLKLLASLYSSWKFSAYVPFSSRFLNHSCSRMRLRFLSLSVSHSSNNYVFLLVTWIHSAISAHRPHEHQHLRAPTHYWQQRPQSADWRTTELFPTLSKFQKPCLFWDSLLTQWVKRLGGYSLLGA